ncbi:MAG: type II secretion system F family protein [Pseudomonadota bacterium]
MVDQLWRYRALSPGGSIAEGSIAAATRDDALARLHAQRLAPLSIAASGRSNPHSRIRFRGTQKAKLSLKQLTAFSEQLADLLSAGLPAATAFDLMRRQSTEPRQRAFLDYCLQKLRGGDALAAAFRSSPVPVPKLMIALTEAGESLGSLDSQFQRLRRHYSAAYRLRSDIMSKLIYPAALGGLVIATLLFLSFFILPQFETIFSNAAAPPPPETRVVLAGGAFVRNYAAAFPAIALTAYCGFRFLMRKNSVPVERFGLRLPIVGGFLLVRESGAFCRSLSALLTGGVALSSAMPLARGAVSISVIAERLANAEHAVNAGAMLAESLEKFEAADDRTLTMISLGEESGELALMCGRAADQADQAVALVLSRIANILSPVMTLIMGLVTAGVIAAVMSGVLSLNEVVY